MKFIVSSSVLQKQLSLLNGVIVSNPIVPILENFLFVIDGETLTATASDLQVSMTTVVQVEADASFKVAVPAKILLETVRSLPDQPITIAIDEETNAIEITSYKGRYKLAGEAAEDYPVIPEVKGNYTLSVSCGVLHKAIANTLFAVSNDDLRPALTGVLLKLADQTANFVATDGHKLVKYDYESFEGNTEATTIIIPKKALALLKSSLPNDDTQLVVAFSSSNAFFKFESVSLVCRLIDEKYPDYENAIPTNNDKTLTIDRNEFLSSLKRLSIYANKLTNQIRLKIQADTLLIKAEDLDYSNEAQESLLCTYTSEEELEIGFNAKFLVEMLSILTSQEIEMTFSTPNRAAIITPKGGLANEKEKILMLVMPVLLNASSYV